MNLIDVVPKFVRMSPQSTAFVYPVELEKAILKHPKVHDVAVIGAPDERLGEYLLAPPHDCFLMSFAMSS